MQKAHTLITHTVTKNTNKAYPADCQSSCTTMMTQDTQGCCVYRHSIRWQLHLASSLFTERCSLPFINSYTTYFSKPTHTQLPSPSIQALVVQTDALLKTRGQTNAGRDRLLTHQKDGAYRQGLKKKK